MKKVQKLLALGLCLALGAGTLVACGNKGGGADGYAEGDLTNYWVAGKIKGVDGWDELDSEENSLVKDAVRFVRSSESGVYTVTLDMWENDQFKIRYLGRGWDDEGGQLNASNNFDEETNGDKENGIAGESGSGMGGKNFQCYNEGNYTVTINANGEKPMVTWTRNGDATEKAPIAAEEVTVKNGETEVTSLTLRVGDPDVTLTATVSPDNATDKTVTWESAKTEFFTVTDGVVHAVAVGEGNLLVKVGGKTLSTIPVTVVAAGTVIVDAESLTIPAAQKTQTKHAGETITVAPVIAPEDTTNKTVTYTVVATADNAASTDPDCVSITAGAIKAVKPGTAVIKATVGAGANAKSDTFTVTVVRDYYLRGNLNGWGEIKEVGESDIIYFTKQGDTEVYKTESVKLKKGNIFKIASVAEDWDNKVIGEKLTLTGITNYFELDGDDGDKNIKCKDTAMYTITLDLTGSEPAITIAWNSDLPDDIDEATALRAHGDATDWGWDGGERPTANFTKANDKWTATLSNVALKATGSWQVRFEVDGVTIYADYGLGNKLVVPADFSKASDSNNIVAAAGTYNITVTLSSDGAVDSVEIVAA